MIDVKEHIYNDDPCIGHPDVKTYLKNVSYFFLGNGLIQAAVQFSPGNEGSPYGLLIMNPEKLRFKRDSLSMSEKSGLQNTMLSLINSSTGEEYEHEGLSARWLYEDYVPVAEVSWKSGPLEVSEKFFCPDKKNSRIIRRMRICNTSGTEVCLTIMTSVPEHVLIKNNDCVKGLSDLELYIQYDLDLEKESINLSFVSRKDPDTEVLDYWKNIASISTGSGLPDKYFKMSSVLLPSVISRTGKVDASIWQYNREWVRDHSYMVMGLILTGSFSLAEIVLERLLKDFISDNGSPMDSSEERDFAEVELDQNGLLISTIKAFYLWTGNKDFIINNWQKISLLADFPMKEEFYHESSGMLFNCRDFWERHSAHGIKPGIEFIHQAMVAAGLKDAAFLARILNYEEKAKKWENFAEKLNDRIFNDPVFKMTDKEGIIKRKNLDGSIQKKITPKKNSGLPPGVPLSKNTDHLLWPDSSTVIPIAFGYVPPDSEAAINTLKQMEILWNQDWKSGGHGRYNCTSEADSSGPWPFSSVIIARAYMEAGDYKNVWRILQWLDTIPGSASGSWFEMYGKRISPPYAQIGITPWTWGEIILLIIQNIAGIFPEEDFIRIRPNLLPEMEFLKLSLPLRNVKLILDIKNRKGIKEAIFKCNSGIIKQNQNEVCVNYSKTDIYIEGIIGKKT